MTMTEPASSTTGVLGPTSAIQIKIGGQAYTDEAAPAVRVEVETCLRMPAMATISFTDDDFHKKAGDFALDADVELAVGLTNSTPVIFKGKIAALEAHRGALRGVTVIRCYDALAKLYGPRKTRTFIRKKYADIVSQIAQENGIQTGAISPAGPPHDYVAQFEENDGEFLERLAAEYGFLLRLDEQWKLSFGPPPELTKQPELPSSTTPGTTQVVLGDDLSSYEITYGPKQSAGTIKTAGWDAIAGAAVGGQATVSSGKKAVEFNKLSPPPPSGDFLLSSIPFRSVDSANQTAKGVADQVAAGFASLRGRVMGNPLVTAGVQLAVGPPENWFSGWYLVTRARHTYEDGQLRTEFVCDGLGDRPAAGSGGPSVLSAAAPPNRVPFAVTGLVTNVTDASDNANGTANLGRVKVKFPTLGWADSNGESDWLRVVAPGAGAERGMWWLPEVGDEVLVVFDRGDMRAGYVIGGVWNGASTPPPDFPGTPTTGDGKVKQRALVTTTNQQLLFTDESGKEAIELKSGDGKLLMKFDQNAGTVTIDADEGKATVIVKCSGDIEIKGSNNITVEATNDLMLKGMNVKVEAQTELSMKGATIKSEASGSFEAKANGTAKLEASGMLTLSASGIAELKGSLVKIN